MLPFPLQVFKILSVPVIFSRSNILSYEFINLTNAVFVAYTILLFLSP